MMNIPFERKARLDEHITEIFDKYCSTRDCENCKYNKDERVASEKMSCNEAYEDDYRKRYMKRKHIRNM